MYFLLVFYEIYLDSSCDSYLKEERGKATVTDSYGTYIVRLRRHKQSHAHMEQTRARREPWGGESMRG